MKLVIKGEKKKYDRDTIRVSELLEIEKVRMPLYVSVEVNGRVIDRKTHDTHELKDGDSVEFMHFMGGGSFMDFTEDQINRYSRHIILEGVGGEGQKKINDSSVLVVGAGGLGSPVLLYLAAAGVGKLGVIDSDRVDITNLQRQIIHSTPDIGRLKTESAREKIEKINPDVKVEVYSERLNAANALEIISGYDFVVDGADNFATKFLINDACVISSKPYSHAGILQFAGQTFSYVPSQGHCLRCVFESPPPADAVPSCSQAGVLGAVAGILGTIQATEVLRYILSRGRLLTNRILSVDAENMEFKTLNIDTDSACPVCSENPRITSLEDEEYREGVC